MAAEKTVNNTNGFFTLEFDTKKNFAWICPNTTALNVQNDPRNFDYGTNYVMVVNACSVAQKVDLDYNVTSYADRNGLQTCRSLD